MWKKSDNGFGANRKKIGDEVMIKLLLVEDDANLCYIIRGGLEDMIGGYEVTTAADGEEGLKIWKEQHPDVIVSDIEMPVMDGYEQHRTHSSHLFYTFHSHFWHLPPVSISEVPRYAHPTLQPEKVS